MPTLGQTMPILHDRGYNAAKSFLMKEQYVHVVDLVATYSHVLSGLVKLRKY